MFINISFFSIFQVIKATGWIEAKKTATNEVIINCSFINVARPGIEPGSKV